MQPQRAGQPRKVLSWCAEVLREQYVKTVLAGYLLWPLAHIINFKFVPADLRILYVNWYSSLIVLPCMVAIECHTL